MNVTYRCRVLMLVLASDKGSVPEWPKGTGCKPVGVCLRRFKSSPAHNRWSRTILVLDHLHLLSSALRQRLAIFQISCLFLFRYLQFQNQISDGDRYSLHWRPLFSRLQRETRSTLLLLINEKAIRQLCLGF